MQRPGVPAGKQIQSQPKTWKQPNVQKSVSPIKHTKRKTRMKFSIQDIVDNYILCGNQSYSTYQWIVCKKNWYSMFFYNLLLKTIHTTEC